MVSYIDKRYCPQNNKPDKCYKSRCKKVFYRHMNVSLPVEITPMACINYFGIKYCGKPKVICLKKKKGTKYELRIMQNICINLPITYKVKVNIGNSFVR